MASEQVPETIIGPRWEARPDAPTEATDQQCPVEGV
ncbi:hypothetical protein SAMN04489713_110170 [Actinomadura madurae]|uniref:Uncharacterized protein n=1 Tax=Actinomadura madurae TaxID=1993 RepID=A0A1I5KXK9_9ACTN|nr:hypothetical protein SAMN04489713_110170 [Actinomadura madurae]